MEVAMSTTRSALFFATCLLFPLAVHAQTFHVHFVGPNLQTIAAPAGQECSVTWYDPEGLTYSDGDIGFLAQGGNPRATCLNGIGIDSIFASRRDGTTWINPSQTACPTLRGLYHSAQTCTYYPGPLASPSIVKIGSRYYMAFVGGNADINRGEIFWATSTDGATWTTFKWDPKPPGYAWRPIVRPIYGDTCSAFGIGQLSLTYDPNPSINPNGTFYIHFLYYHPSQIGALDTMAFRMPFNPTNNFGIGGQGQLCIAASTATNATCAWTNHSGNLVWDYDGQPAQPGDPVLGVYRGMRQMGFGGGDVKWNPDQSNWLHVYGFGGKVYWQSTTSLASSLWTAAKEVDLSALDTELNNRYPGKYQSAERYYGGLWYGTSGGRTGMWMYQPVDVDNCSWPFAGLRIVMVSLRYY
jgi:hypothetical protein